MPWPEGGDLILNLHLHPSGKLEKEQSSLGFFFTDEPPQRALLDLLLIDMKIDIPPGEKSYHTQDSFTLPLDTRAVSIFPHMHMIGKEIKVTATLPDGTAQPLLWIDDWDFNWQDVYEYASPVVLPKGTKIALECTHDNSADNPHNPKSPPEQVRWGEQTFNEMSIAFVNLIPANDQDLIELQARPLRRLTASIVPASLKEALAATAVVAPSGPGQGGGRSAAEMLRNADKNNDEKLSLEEILAVLGNRLPAAEIEKIVSQFDKDGDKQLNLAEVTEVLKMFGRR
jgi:hypothetical protein